MRLKRPLPPTRTFQQVKHHYEVEKAIREKLWCASLEQRKAIYPTMYDELFENVPDHPRLQRRKSEASTSAANRFKFNVIRSFVDKSTVFAEFAPGDCRFSEYVCEHAAFVYGIDISDQRDKGTPLPNNFELLVYDGYHLALEDGSIDVVFSDQLIEHLHPEDAELHFKLVRRLLRAGGVYIFRTPHNYVGPSDVSGYFSDKAEGFHLKEWTYGEIASLLKNLGYSSCSGHCAVKGMPIRIPLFCITPVERILGKFPKRLRRLVSRLILRSVTTVAVK
ncbi:MAG: class I SAM-dependent methyltransferase [Acidobacteriota bacterium]